MKSRNSPKPFPGRGKGLIGVLYHPLIEKKRGFPAGQLPGFRELVMEGKRHGFVVFVFAPEDVNLKNKKIVGSTLIWKGDQYVWQSFKFPLPDVVYNRILKRSLEKRLKVRNIMTGLEKLGKTVIFNPCYLNKWEVYNWLTADDGLIFHLPATGELTLENLRAFLYRYRTVFVKPKAGSLGQGIIRVEKVKQGCRCLRRSNGLFVDQEVPKVQDVIKLVGRSKTRSYLIQQGINLMLYENAPFDIRALVQKDGSGSWSLTGMAARVAAPLAHLTHVPNGGRAAALSVVLAENLYPKEREKVIAALKDFAVRVATSLEEKSGLMFGELSLDIGLDQDRRIWLIEVNSKPFRFDEEDIRKLSKERIIEYAGYLINKKVGKRGEK